jgi:peptidyl-tRNA hydrolase, PTH1 family
MHLVVGLGNPGREYERTRHNVGFKVVERLAANGAFGPWRLADQAVVSRGKIGNTDVLLVKPQTFMNLSGEAVGGLLRFYKADPAELIVVHDDMDFECGVVRVKLGGGHGGHNGLKSIAAHCGRDFARVRVGIGKPATAALGTDFVLSGFDKGERSLVDDAIALAADAVVVILDKGIAAAMSLFNRRREAPGVEDE